jgi:hypothetical protein
MKQNDLDKLLVANPKAKGQENVVRAAMDAVRAVRELGILPKGYSLSSPFAKRGPLKSTTKAARLKRTVDA